MLELARCVGDLAGLMLDRLSVCFTAASVDFADAVLVMER
jgi:hypothetical protein